MQYAIRSAFNHVRPIHFSDVSMKTIDYFTCLLVSFHRTQLFKITKLVGLCNHVYYFHSLHGYVAKYSGH